jgi:hypothetical protein
MALQFYVKLRLVLLLLEIYFSFLTYIYAWYYSDERVPSDNTKYFSYLLFYSLVKLYSISFNI